MYNDSLFLINSNFHQEIGICIFKVNSSSKFDDIFSIGSIIFKYRFKEIKYFIYFSHIFNSRRVDVDFISSEYGMAQDSPLFFKFEDWNFIRVEIFGYKIGNKKLSFIIILANSIAEISLYKLVRDLFKSNDKVLWNGAFRLKIFLDLFRFGPKINIFLPVIAN